MKKKHKLVIISAPDRCGKDTILDSISPTRKLFVFKQHNVGIPHYRAEGEDFSTWLNQYLVRQNTRLIEEGPMKDRDVIMARLFTSEFVYSKFFGRESIINDIYFELLQHFDFYQLIILFKNYDEYLRRCETSSSEVEYDEDEFNQIQRLYLTSPFNTMMPTTIRIGANEPSWQSRDIVLNMIG